MTGPLIVPGQADGSGGDDWAAALFALMRSVLTLAGLVDTVARAENWTERRRMLRVVDRYLATVVAQVDGMRSRLDVSPQHRGRGSVARSRRGGGS